MNKTKLLGAWGEATAAEFYRKKKYVVQAVGFQCRFGEIDLIVKNKKYLVFCEVKLRKSDQFAEAMEFVDHFKQNRLKSTAAYYLSKYPTELQSRFDVIEIYAPEGCATAKPIIRHLEDAFQ